MMIHHLSNVRPEQENCKSKETELPNITFCGSFLDED